MSSRSFARILALSWAGWWIVYCCIFNNADGTTVTECLVRCISFGSLFIISALIPWKWEFEGGIVLLFEGLLILLAYPAMAFYRFSFARIILVLITVALPPLVSGVMFLSLSRKKKAINASAHNI